MAAGDSPKVKRFSRPPGSFPGPVKPLGHAAKSFVFLTIDTTPGYTDTQPLPAAPAKWTYKAVFRQGEAQVGNWSAPVALTVGA